MTCVAMRAGQGPALPGDTERVLSEKLWTHRVPIAVRKAKKKALPVFNRRSGLPGNRPTGPTWGPPWVSWSKPEEGRNAFLSLHEEFSLVYGSIDIS